MPMFNKLADKNIELPWSSAILLVGRIGIYFHHRINFGQLSCIVFIKV